MVSYLFAKNTPCIMETKVSVHVYGDSAFKEEKRRSRREEVEEKK